ncbi:24-hydroxycholesterol 7-alpha-hydroxylase isoform X4 [Podarcis raffonei]|uniref:24-hydroxycholesterol 7-alpha-hydroxylase isoform X4 n=1 Tax=Podarcis raffonei TaxID=65483 RepID=UPI0023290BFC|nr:24-hydroxycholesterol 7-alpha-hydroxylase isoform X4 [Podarcis raffonei]
MEIILALLFTVVLGLVVKHIFFPFKNINEPPCIHGCIPWFGAAFKFGKAPLKFIKQAGLKYGPVFTVYMLGKRYTFVTDEEGFQAFCISKDVDFAQAVQQSVQHTASIPEEIFYKNRSRLYIMMKGRLSTSNLQHMPRSLCQELQRNMEGLGHEGTEELRDLVRHIMFPSTVNTLFGKDIFLTTRDNVKEFEEHYQNFDDDFEYATQLPKYFLKKWSKSKKWLLKSFEKVVLHAEETNPSDDSSKVSFWTLAFILSQPSVYKEVMDELEPVYRKSGKENIQLSEDDLKKLPFIKWCILETIRLRAPGAIIKKVIAPMTIQNFVIPAGDLLVLSPYWIHRNPKYFPEPNTFKPDRWKEANLEKNVSLEGFVAFGAGGHQCPGRWFAIMEIQILVAMLLCKYECHLLDPLPKESLLHLVGTQQPEGPCRIQYKLRI